MVNNLVVVYLFHPLDTVMNDQHVDFPLTTPTKIMMLMLMLMMFATKLKKSSPFSSKCKSFLCQEILPQAHHLSGSADTSNEPVVLLIWVSVVVAIPWVFCTPCWTLRSLMTE
jgi:hypothetical protein